MKDTKQTSLMLSASWLLVAKMIGFVLSFLLPILIYQTLSKGDVGIYQQVFLVIVTVSGILPFGVSLSAYYFLSRDSDRKPYYIFNILLFNFVAGGLACLLLNLYPQILEKVTKDSEMTALAPQIGFVIWLWVFSSFLETVIVANQEARLATVIIIAAQLNKAVFMISAVFFWGTVQALLNAATILAGLETIALFVYLNSRFKGFWRSFDKTLFVEQLRYALPFGFAGFLLIAQNEAHNYFVSFNYPKEAVAIYRAGCFQLPLLVLLYESVSYVMIPRMSQLQSKGNKREMIELTARAMGKIAIVFLPVYVFFQITATTLITTLFTKNFAESVPIFLVNITLLPFYVFIIDPLIRAFGSLGKFILRLRIFIVALLLPALYFGMQRFDLTGMIAIVVAASLIERFVSIRKLCRQLEVNLSDIRLLKPIGKTAIAAVLSGIPGFVVYSWIKFKSPNLVLSFFPNLGQTWLNAVEGTLTLVLTAAAFGGVYIVLIFLLGVLSDNEKDQIFGKLQQFKTKISTSSLV